MERALHSIQRLAIPGFVSAVAVGQSIYDVKGGSRAVIFDRLQGVKDSVVSEGTHFLVPWLQRAIVFDVRTKPRHIATTTGSKDLQMVSLTLRVLHRPEIKSLPKIYQVCIARCSISPRLGLYPSLRGKEERESSWSPYSFLDHPP